MLLIRKNTKLKAIHNKYKDTTEISNVVAYTQKYKIESNSQPVAVWLSGFTVVAYTQKYKIESNSQLISKSKRNTPSCCLYAKIQNWKQFTTTPSSQ